MRMRYINQVKKNISIHATKKSINILDGSYLSVYKGRTQNFEDLRGYVSGDNVKDIDWKSSARTQTLLVRRYIAEKKHNVMLVMDTGKKMLADTDAGESKKGIALMCGATLAYIANHNGDYVNVAYRHEDRMEVFRRQSNLYEIEEMLAHYDVDVDGSDASNMESTLSYLARKWKDRSIIFLITDLAGMQEISQETLKKLTLRHDVLCICIEDANLYGERAYDIEESEEIPEILRKDKKLLRYEKQQKDMIRKECEQKFLQCKIVTTKVSAQSQIIPKIIELLGRHKHANRC